MSRLDTGNSFQKFIFEKGELEAARCINPYNLMYLQNKIADYALMVLEYRYDPNKPKEVAILEHEKLKAGLAVLQELQNEFIVPNPSV